MAKRVLHDQYFKQAKREGYLARSAYKLLEINKRARLIRRGDLVLDLGCAPGSWCQVASDLTGPKGAVVGIDLKPAEPNLGHNVRTIIGDMTQLDPTELTALLDDMFDHTPPPPDADKDAPPDPRLFDVVISDMAPNTSGKGDDLRSCALCERILDRLHVWLRPRGRLTMKVLEGAEFPALVKRTQRMFEHAKAFKPDASRDVSRETYIIAHRYKGPKQNADLPRAGAPPAPPPGWSEG